MTTFLGIAFITKRSKHNNTYKIYPWCKPWTPNNSVKNDICLLGCSYYIEMPNLNLQTQPPSNFNISLAHEFLGYHNQPFLGGKFHSVIKFWKFLCHKVNDFFQKQITKIWRKYEKNLTKISTFLHMVQAGSQ